MNKSVKSKRQAPAGAEFPVRYEYDSDGKLHLYFDDDVVIHYKNKTEEVSGSSLEYSTENHHIVTGGFAHINPWGERYHDDVIKSDSPDIRDTMIAKEEFYKKNSKLERQLRLKEKLAKRNYNYLKRNKCSC